MSTIEFHALLHAALHFHVLSHLDLGRDSASLYNDNQEERSWVSSLLRAHQNASGRLALQFLPLQTGGLEELRHRLRHGGIQGLGDPQGRTLRAAFLAAIDLEKQLFAMAWGWEQSLQSQRLARASRALGEPLTKLREALWDGTGPVPPLIVLDCAALGTHGRAVSHGDRRVVAVNLGAGMDHALLQIFHEEIHPVTDRLVMQEVEGVDRDTRAGSEGYALHQRLEEAAVARGREVIREHAPDLADGYEAWAGRFGMAV
jgi:hypothetical protein